MSTLTWSWHCLPAPCGILELAAICDTQFRFSHSCGRGCPWSQSPETQEAVCLCPRCTHFLSAIYILCIRYLWNDQKEFFPFGRNRKATEKETSSFSQNQLTFGQEFNPFGCQNLCQKRLFFGQNRGILAKIAGFSQYTETRKFCLLCFGHYLGRYDGWKPFGRTLQILWLAVYNLMTPIHGK